MKKRIRIRKWKTEVFKYDLNLEFALSFKKNQAWYMDVLGDGESKDGSSWGKLQRVATGRK